MQTSRKVEEKQLNEDLSSQGFSKPGLTRQRRLNYNSHHTLQERSHGANWSANSETRAQTPERKVFKANQKKNPGIGNRIRGRFAPKNAPLAAHNSINKYRFQIKRFIQSLEEYKKMEEALKITHESLATMRKDILGTLEADPGDIPDVESSIQDLIQGFFDSKLGEDQSRLNEVEREVSDIKVAFMAVEEEKKQLLETLDIMNFKLKCKEEELIKVKELETIKSFNGEGDIEEIQSLKNDILKLDMENSDLTEKLKKMENCKDKGETKDDQKVKSLEKLIENLHVEMKKLKDQLRVEKEWRSKLEMENGKLDAEIKDLKNLVSSSDSKNIMLEKDNKIQDLQKRLSDISRIRPHQSSGNQEVFKVDFSADTPSLVTQLAKFVQLYEEVAREGFDLESKLKESHVEIYRLEQILEKQLAKIKEQDNCLESMEESLNKVVLDSRIASRSENLGHETIQCKCDEFQTLIKEKEEFSEKLKEKMSLLYQKYKQYKSECNIMKKKLDAFEKKSWLKKLVNI